MGYARMTSLSETVHSLVGCGKGLPAMDETQRNLQQSPARRGSSKDRGGTANSGSKGSVQRHGHSPRLRDSDG